MNSSFFALKRNQKSANESPQVFTTNDESSDNAVEVLVCITVDNVHLPKSMMLTTIWYFHIILRRSK